MLALAELAGMLKRSIVMQKMTYVIELTMNHINNIPIQKEEIAVSDRDVAITVAKE